MFEQVSEPTLFTEGKQYVFDQLTAGTFVPKIAKTFTLEQIVDAHRYMESNEQIGKIVVLV